MMDAVQEAFSRCSVVAVKTEDMVGQPLAVRRGVVVVVRRNPPRGEEHRVSASADSTTLREPEFITIDFFVLVDDD